MKTQLARQTIRISVDLVVSMQDINDGVIKRVTDRYLNPAWATEPDTLEHIERDRLLQQALLTRPELLLSVFKERALIRLDTFPQDNSLKEAEATLISDTELVERLRDDLTPAAYSYLHDVAEEDVFYENTSFFQEAIEVEQRNVQVMVVDNPSVSAAANTDDVAESSDTSDQP